jgi:hypothetical protein
MVTATANLDLLTYKILDAPRLNESLSDLSDEELGIIFVARDREFVNEAWKADNDKTYICVVLPYEEVLTTDNIDLLAYRHLYKQLELIEWMDIEPMKKWLETKMAELN